MKVAHSCLILCDPMVITVHGILQARILEWVAFPFSRGPSQPRDWTQVFHTAGRFFTSWATREALREKGEARMVGRLELAAEPTWTALPNSALWKSVNATNEDFSPEPMIYFFFFFQPSNAACAILVPWPEIEPMSSAVKAYSPNYWTAREFPVINIHWHSTGEGPGDLW